MSTVVLTFSTWTTRQTPQVLEIIDINNQTFTNDTHVGIKNTLSITQGANDTNPFERYHTSRLTYSFRLTNSDLVTFYENLVSGEEGRYFVKYYFDGQVEFIGVILPDVGGVELDQNNPVLTITAVDILADIKGRALSGTTIGTGSGLGEYPSIRNITLALSNSAIYDLYDTDDIVISSAVPIYAAGMDTDNGAGREYDSMSQLAVQDFIWRKRDEIDDDYEYEDCDKLIIDYLNVVNGRIYTAKGRIVIENIYVRSTDGPIKYFNYTKFEAETASKTKGTFVHTAFDKKLYNIVSLGGGNTTKAVNKIPVHRHLPPARAAHLVKSGYDYVNVLKNRDVIINGLVGTPVTTWGGSYGIERRLTTVNEIGDNRLIIDVVVEAYVDGTGIDSSLIRQDYVIECDWVLRIEDEYLNNKNNVVTLSTQFESVAMMEDLPWANDPATVLTIRNTSTIPVKGHVDQGVFDQKKIQKIRLISEALPRTGDFFFEIDDIRILVPVTLTTANLPNGAKINYRFLQASKIGFGEQIEAVYDESEKVTVKRLSSARNRHIYELETRLIDYDDNPNDPRALILPYKYPFENVGLTDWTDNTLGVTDKIDEIILSQVISMTRNPPRLIDVEANTYIDFSNRYRHKYRLTNDYYICMPVRRTFNADRETTNLTALVMNTDGAAGVQTTFTTDKGLTGLAIDANTFQLLNGPDGGNFQNTEGNIYPLYFEDDNFTGDELTVTEIILPDPANITEEIRKKIMVVVGGIEYRLVDAISSNPRLAARQVTTITASGQNKLKFGRTLSNQDVSVRQFSAYSASGTTS